MLSGRLSGGLAPYRTESVLSDRESPSQPVSSGCTRLTLEEMIQSSTLSSNPNEREALEIYGDNFLQEVNEQNIIASTSSNMQNMGTVENTTSSLTATSAYTVPSHLQTHSIMETRAESIFNQRKRVRPVVPTHLPFDPVQTINQYLPTGSNPLTGAILTQMELVSFDRFSRGLAYLAERRRPEGLMNGYISSERMDKERKRQYRLWELAVLAEKQSMQNSFSFDNNDSSDNETLDSATDIQHSGTDGLESAHNTPIERVELLFNTDVNNERRKRKLRKTNEGNATNLSESEYNSDNNEEEEEESSEEDHEES